MPRTAPWRGIQAKIVKTCDKTGGIFARIGRTFKETAAICAEIVAIFGKTTETCEPTGRIFGKTTAPFVMTGNKCSMMNTLGRVPANSNRTGKMSVATVTISKAIVGIYELIARTGEEIGRMSEPIDET